MLFRSVHLSCHKVGKWNKRQIYLVCFDRKTHKKADRKTDREAEVKAKVKAD